MTRLVAGLQDCFKNQFNRLFVQFQLGRKSAFITHAGAVSLLVKDRLQRVERFDGSPQTFAEGWSTHRGNHELLKINIAVSVTTTV